MQEESPANEDEHDVPVLIDSWMLILLRFPAPGFFIYDINGRLAAT
jgi:hypothetical protein